VDARTRFFASLDDDFNTPEAFGVLAEVVRAVNTAVDGERPGADQLREAKHALLDLLDVFGLAGLEAPEAVPENVLDLARRRDEARAGRDFARADALRAEILGQGFEVRDTPEGTQVYRA
jgi:cysteinyl-tRNA synthetase